MVTTLNFERTKQVTHSSVESIGVVNCGISASFQEEHGYSFDRNFVECPSRSKLRMWFTVGIKLSTYILENAMAFPQGVGTTSRTQCTYQMAYLRAANIRCFRYLISTRSLARKYFRWECFILREALLSLYVLNIIPVSHANRRAVLCLYLNFNDGGIIDNYSCNLSWKRMIPDL